MSFMDAMPYMQSDDDQVNILHRMPQTATQLCAVVACLKGGLDHPAQKISSSHAADQCTGLSVAEQMCNEADRTQAIAPHQHKR